MPAKLHGIVVKYSYTHKGGVALFIIILFFIVDPMEVLKYYTGCSHFADDSAYYLRGA